MKHESVAVRGEDERDVERRGVGEALLDATGHAVRIVLGLDQGQRDVPFEIEDIVGPLGLAARDQPAAHDDAALGGTHLVADLQHLVASRLPQGGRDELGADVAFAECALVHPAGANSWVSTIRAHYSRKPKRRAPAAHPQKCPYRATLISGQKPELTSRVQRSARSEKSRRVTPKMRQAVHDGD